MKYPRFIRGYVSYLNDPQYLNLNFFDPVLTKRMPFVFQVQVATVANLVRSLRNQFLYPTPDGAGYRLPEESLTPRDSADLARRVGGIISQISRRL
ncbi:hypothetical protein ACFLTK_03190 [Chloroflexota bacterium]